MSSTDITKSEETFKMYEEEVGWRLRQVRESRSLSRKDVENMTGGEFKESILAMYESARRRIPTPRLKKLADFYQVSIAFLLGELPDPRRIGKPFPLEALLMADHSLSTEEKRLISSVLEIIHAKRRAEGRE